MYARKENESPKRKMAELNKIVYKKSITFKNMNQCIVNMEYAVRGPVSSRLLEIERHIDKGVKMPFQNLIKTNIGDCHSMGQLPITFIRQVLAGLSYPELLSSRIFPEDVNERVGEILSSCGGHSIGSYTSSIGIDAVRRSVADYIQDRDGFECDWTNICLTPGASAAIKNCLQLLVNKIDGKTSGVMIPTPQYPMYSATLAEYGLNQVDYYLDEKRNWGLTTQELERAYIEGSKSCSIRALVVINPGNPTGQVLTQENMEDIIRFAFNHGLLILADEVYQHNIFEGKFCSFKKALMEMGFPWCQVELVSIMSVSKGYMGECGLRGGWMEIVNMDETVRTHLYKGISARQCPNTLGQAVVDCVVRPPVKGDPSYGVYLKERTQVLDSLKRRARMIEYMFSDMEGISCNRLQGAMYAFPRIELPPRALEAAARVGQLPDVFYAFRLLEETGVCVVPGSGFGQAPGTHHFRTTILTPVELMNDMVANFRRFHENFIREYSD